MSQAASALTWSARVVFRGVRTAQASKTFCPNPFEVVIPATLENTLGGLKGSHMTLKGMDYRPIAQLPFYARTWETNMRKKTYRSRKRKRFIRVGERILRIS
ncbi:hypothetical protein BgAZ_209520 [Babesia gibsoni]|uniref:Uncharacterized protein n=1 Tax=Babesia gibsoni TaxID=33632 RepID=A0AAD8PEV1_BABGI|nr:hypothetical protein BgAZ_209520 [Babesia gibsoni]